jgi:hypothetical protein
MPRKSTKAADPMRRIEIAAEIVAVLREMDELSAEPLNDGSSLVAVVGFIDIDKVVDRLITKESKP